MSLAEPICSQITKDERNRNWNRTIIRNDMESAIVSIFAPFSKWFNVNVNSLSCSIESIAIQDPIYTAHPFSFIPVFSHLMKICEIHLTSSQLNMQSIASKNWPRNYSIRISEEGYIRLSSLDRNICSFARHPFSYYYCILISCNNTA